MLLKNTPSIERLYRLVTNMTAPQKRAFRRDANYWKDQRNEMKYFTLFDKTNKYINRGGKEAGFFEYLLSDQKKTFERKETSAQAGYLFDRILVSMRSIPERSEEFVRLNGLVKDAYFLYNKSLWADCLYIIKSATNLALRLDRPAYITELCLLERRVLSRSSGLKENENYLLRLDEREKNALLQIQLFSDFFNTAEIFRGAINQQQELTSEIIAKAESYISGYQETDDAMYGTFLGLRNRLQVLNLFSNYYRYKQNFHATDDTVDYSVKAFDTTQKIIKLLKSNSELRDEMPTYLSLIETYIIRCLHTRNFSELELHLKEFENYPDELIRYRTGKYIRFQTFLTKGDYEAARKYLEQHDLGQNWKRLAEKIWPTRLATAYYGGMMTYLVLLNYAKALHWNALIMEAAKDHKMYEHLFIAKIVEIICLGYLGADIDPVLLLVDLKQEEHLTDPAFIKSLFSLLIAHFSGSIVRKNLQNLKDMDQLLLENSKLLPYSYILAWLTAQHDDISATDAMRKFD